MIRASGSPVLRDFLAGNGCLAGQAADRVQAADFVDEFFL